MYIITIGSSPGESQIVVFDDGSIITIDATKKLGRNYTLSTLDDLGLSYDNVMYNVITHFHNDHIKGVYELILKCPNSKIAIPPIWKDLNFKRFISEFNASLSGTKNQITTEIEKVFSFLGANKPRLVFAGEQVQLYPGAGSASATRFIVLSPTHQRQADFIAGLGALIQADKIDEAKAYGLNNENDCSVCCLVEKGQEVAVLCGDLQNLEPSRDIDYIIDSHLKSWPKIKFLKMAHHGSKTSFSDRLRHKIHDDETIVAITPYPSGKTKLPNQETRAFLSGVKQTWVLSGKSVAVPKNAKALKRKYVVSNLSIKKDYVPGILEYFSGSVSQKDCVTLDDFLT